jgi:topoisomerase-4 subunit A
LFISTAVQPIVNYELKVRNNWVADTINLAEFIDVKGWKAIGNRLSSEKLRNFELVIEESIKSEESNTSIGSENDLHIGDTIEFDLEDGQGTLF